MSLTYRPEIDGMRTIAIMSVMIYHLKISIFDDYFFPGGFLGVDIFFVLSGYLITGILLKELANNQKISFLNFYTRRARRIIPALLLVIIVSIPVAWFVLLPSEMIRYAQSLLASIGFYSNIFWFFELGEYGAQSGLLQAFLHTWSLAIEEQFYIVFPLVLFIIYRTTSVKWLGIIIITFIVLSLAFAQFTTELKPPLSFFSPTSRVWELLAGSAVAYISFYYPHLIKKNYITDKIPLLSALVLLYGITTVNLEESWHPGLTTLPYIIATCGIILYASPSSFTIKLLSTPLFVNIGKISYSLYLWHFPIFAFGRLTSLDEPTFIDMFIWILLTFLLSWLGYKYIETPFRHKVNNKTFFITIFATIALVFFFSTYVISNKGIPERYSEITKIYGKNEIDNEVLADKTLRVFKDTDTKLEVDRRLGTGGKRSDYESNHLWFESENSEKVLIIGNSHSKDMFNALYLNRQQFENIEFARLAFDPDFKEKSIFTMFETPNYQAATTILIAPKYRMSSVTAIDGLIPTLLEDNKRVILVGNTAEFVSPSQLPIFDWYTQKTKQSVEASELNQLAYKYESVEAQYYTKRIREVAKKHGLLFYDRRSLLCNDEKRSCTLKSPDGWKTMSDNNHWTLEGAKYFGNKAKEADWFNYIHD